MSVAIDLPTGDVSGWIESIEGLEQVKHVWRYQEAFVASVQLVERGSGVTLVLTHPDQQAVSAWASLGLLLRVVGVALDNGAINARVLSSGRQPKPDQWKHLRDEAELAIDDLASSGNKEIQIGARYGLMAALRDAFVSQLVSDNSELYSCGMHVLGKPDIVTEAVPKGEMNEVWEVVCRFEEYLLAEAASGAVQEGHTFAITNPKRTYSLSREPCKRYTPGTPYYNPWGYWRLTEVR